ncbi:MAG: Rieske 2Fe-2S domain-containing protein [Pseudonocardiales bacterium]|nr:Rieske 2Fe-2S domain-containing protein [Pseudonocardiales bacterium]
MLVALGEPDGDPRVVESADGRRFAVFPLDGGFRVTDGECPHNRGPLAEGRIDGRTLVCPWHWYRFDLDSGQCVTSPRHHLAVYPVVRMDGAWFAEVGDKPPVLSWSDRLRAHARGTG